MSPYEPVKRRSGPVALLDIGTSKITCIIASVVSRAGTAGSGSEPVAGRAGDNTQPVQALRLLGIGNQRSAGMKAGLLVDPEAAEPVVRAAVAQAERMAGCSVEHVHLSVSCGRIKSIQFRAHADLDSGYVEADDIARLITGARAYAEREGRLLLHLNTVRSWLDGANIGATPPRLAGRGLAVDYHAVTADDGPVRNLIDLASRCYLGVASIVPAGYASALAVTSQDERRVGVTTIDMGAGATSIAVFASGILQACDAIPIGGDHLTSDVMRQLVTHRAEAERIKTLYGSVVAAASDELEDFTYPFVGADEPQLHQATKAQLRQILVPRVASQIRLIGERLAALAPMTSVTEGPVVLTGGASQLLGLAPFAAQLLGRPVRVGRPRPLVDMLEGNCSHGFAAVVGLGAVVLAGRSIARAPAASQDSGGSYFGRVESWLKESF